MLLVVLGAFELEMFIIKRNNSSAESFATTSSIKEKTPTPTSLQNLTLATVTYKSKETASPTPTPTSASTPTPSIDTTSTAIISTLISTVQPVVLETVNSPDNHWQAKIEKFDCTKIVAGEWYENAYEVLQITHLQDQHIFSAADQLRYCQGTGYYGLGGLKWSPNSHYLYFTNAREGVPEGEGKFGWQRSIFRFDTSTSKTEYLGDGPFSPDRNKLAVMEYPIEVGCKPGSLVVMKLDGDLLVQYPVNLLQGSCWTGYITWLPGSNELYYIETICNKENQCKSSFYHIDLVKDERKVLLIDHQPIFKEVTWEKPGYLTLVDENYKIWSYNMITAKLEPKP
jgi:hypothetical protein